jgi:hypothetical protein
MEIASLLVRLVLFLFRHLGKCLCEQVWSNTIQMSNKKQICKQEGDVAILENKC